MANDLINSDDFRSRNRFLATVLFIFGLIQFATNVRSAQDVTALELLSSAAFFTMMGSFMVLLILSVDTYDTIAMAVTVFILSVGMLMYLVYASYVVHDKDWCDQATACSSKVMGMPCLFPFLFFLMSICRIYSRRSIVGSVYVSDYRIGFIQSNVSKSPIESVGKFIYCVVDKHFVHYLFQQNWSDIIEPIKQGCISRTFSSVHCIVIIICRCWICKSNRNCSI